MAANAVATLAILNESLSVGERLWLLAGATRADIDHIRQSSRPGDAFGILPRTLLPVINRYERTFQQELLAGISEISELALWQKNRILITIDPDLWDELDHITDDDILSADVFGYLPYTDPYIQFPEPIVLPTATPGLVQRVVGMYVTGARKDHTQSNLADLVCSSSDPQTDTLAVKFAGFITPADNPAPRVSPMPWDPTIRIADIMWTRCPLPFPRTIMRFGDMAQICRDQFQYLATVSGNDERLDIDPDAASAQLIAMLRRAVATLTYLCCSNADLRPVHQPKARARKDRRRPVAQRKPAIVHAGYTIGAAIRAWRTEYRNTPSSGSGRVVRPHPRRGHFQRFRIGPGRTQLSQPRYIAMVFVNARLADGTTITVKPLIADPPP